MMQDCSICNKTYMSKRGLALVVAYPENESTLVCSICVDQVCVTCVLCDDVFYGADGVECPMCDTDASFFYGDDEDGA